MEDNLKTKNGRRPKKKMEDEPINQIGCDTIVNSPSYWQVTLVMNFRDGGVWAEHSAQAHRGSA